MNVLVLSDNKEILERAKPIFRKRTDVKYCFTNSDDINPKLDYQHILKTYQLVFSLHCKKIFPPELINGVRCINIHPGFNPYNRGMYPHVWSIINRLPAGATIHQMNEEIDAGPMICQTQIKINAFDTSESLYERIVEEELRLLNVYLNALIDDQYSLTHLDKGNYNSLEDYRGLCALNMEKRGTFRHFYNILRA